MHRFKPIIKRKEAVGAFGKEMVEQGEETAMFDRIWKEGDKWRPESAEMCEVPSDDKNTSTFHGFLPRHNRPNRAGLSHLGYDYIYYLERDGKSYTAEDVPDRLWNESRTSDLEFVSSTGEKRIVDIQLSIENVTLTKELRRTKPLRKKLEENAAANSKQAPYQGAFQRSWFRSPWSCKLYAEDVDADVAPEFDNLGEVVEEEDNEWVEGDPEPPVSDNSDWAEVAAIAVDGARFLSPFLDRTAKLDKNYPMIESFVQDNEAEIQDFKTIVASACHFVKKPLEYRNLIAGNSLPDKIDLT
ncbi:hypothetical protein VP1G_02396 [Cytospora mali]|uniref:Uncharacterized protein n=1 Tax=Cytospora mali TaxID=578113 RepID=A0A194UTD4_CYTMA|nr:hypothetical protein VP1G_02396 [Valsa mali var. pyri (nom. inval.)]